MFFLKSLIYPLFSPSFYREAVKKGQKKAFGVFTLFTIITSIIISIYFIINTYTALQNLPSKLENFPEIKIENGELSYTGEMPAVFTQEGEFFAIDTTGMTTAIPSEYYQGVLLTKYTIIVRSAEYQGDKEIGYDQLLEGFNKNRITINGKILTTMVNNFETIIIVLSPFVVTIGNFIAHLFVILIIAFIGFLILSTMKQPDAFKKSFIIALYASIPIFYINILEAGIIILIPPLKQISSFCCFINVAYALFKWSIFWGLGAYGVQKTSKDHTFIPQDHND